MSTTATPRVFSSVNVPEARARHIAAADAALDGAAMAGQAVDGSPAADAAVEGSSAAGAPTGACMPEAVDLSCGSNRYNATWGVTFRPTTIGFCEEFGRRKVGCSNCPGCTLAKLLNRPGPCQYEEGCDHQCSATDNQRHGGICFRHRDGPCQYEGCVHQCKATDIQKHGGICGLHRDGGVATAAAATNGSNPGWTDEEKNLLSELAVEHTDAYGNVHWDVVTPLLPGNRSRESVRGKWSRMRKANKSALTTPAATLPRVIAPTLPGYDGDLPLLHEGEKRAAAGAEGAATERVAGAEAEELPAPADDDSVAEELQALFDDGSISSLINASEQPIKKSKSRQGKPKKCNCKNSKCPNAADPALDPEQQQQQQQQQQLAGQLAARLEALSTALGVGALSPALYEQARRELKGQ